MSNRKAQGRDNKPAAGARLASWLRRHATLGAILSLVALIAAQSLVAMLVFWGATTLLHTPSGGREIAAIVVFLATYVVIALGKAPGLHLDRAGAALFGASLMLALGVVTLEDAYKAIDLDTITLLLGMMIVIANLRLSGFFRLVAGGAARFAARPLHLLTAIVLITATLSAFLVNDAICLVMTPLVLDLVRRLRRDAEPYLMAIALASNVGSVATITGNPQNMIIGNLSHIPYASFAAALWPIAAFGSLLTIALVAVFHRREFLTGERLTSVEAPAPHIHKGLVAKSAIVTAAMMACFFIGIPVAKVAIVGGAFMLLTRIVRADKVYREIDWPLLLMFAGLFVVVDALQKEVMTPQFMQRLSHIDLTATPTLAVVTAVLSNIVSNVPAVLVLKPFLAHAADPSKAWLVVAMASTLAGNFTLVGSMANLIVAQKAQEQGARLGFWPYFLVGAPLTILTILFGVFWL